METPRDILDARLARGEISAQEHEALAARLAPGAKPAPAEPAAAARAQAPAANHRLKGSYLWGMLGVGGAVLLFSAASNLPKGIVADCVSQGLGDLAFCQNQGVNWGAVAAVYIAAGLVGLFGLANFALPKR
jgi:hypothetical protein